jgi:hypothetical protein
MGDFRIQAEQDGAGKGIHGVEHARKLIQDRRLVESLMRQNGTSRAKSAAGVSFRTALNLKTIDYERLGFKSAAGTRIAKN